MDVYRLMDTISRETELVKVWKELLSKKTKVPEEIEEISITEFWDFVFGLFLYIRSIMKSH